MRYFLYARKSTQKYRCRGQTSALYRGAACGIARARQAPLVRKAFELYARNGSRLEDIANFLFQHGIKTGATRGWSRGGGRPLKKDQITFLLSNPFYFGHFKYS